MLQIIGPVGPPPAIAKWMTKGNPNAQAAPGLIPFINALIMILIIIAGLYTFLNLIFAGYQFISAGGDPKAVEKAWAKIWQSIVGLLIVAASFLLAAIFGWLLFGDPTAILIPILITP